MHYDCRLDGFGELEKRFAPLHNTEEKNSTPFDIKEEKNSET